ncbi:exodeoxyribonuclease VII small subunit [Planctomicrobium sp. SH661]|uniref:exodeoxyribonuclease VII small subunit n=1 Tax=Planctomicrobium sp. SH661 TaxID=3448124 RepID=UPI003F5CA74B
MTEQELTAMTYEEKEQRLDEILNRLDRSETPMDQLSSEAKEAAELIMSMQATLKSTKAELQKVFLEMDRQKEQLDSAASADRD